MGYPFFFLVAILIGNHKLDRLISIDTWRKVNAIHDQMPQNINRWIQAPAILEDALGRVIPIHLDLIDSWEVSWTPLYKFPIGIDTPLTTIL
jgi:hypothetical protein